MKVFSISSGALAFAAFTLVSLNAVHAGNISTPIIFLGDSTQLICIGNNVTNASIVVSVKIIGQQTTSVQNWTLPGGRSERMPGI